MQAKLMGANRYGWQFYMVVLLVICLIQFSGVWIYPAIKFGMAAGMTEDRPIHVIYQRMVWVLLIYAFIRVAQRGLGALAVSLRAFMPFLLMGLVAAVFGYSPIDSMRMLIMWCLMAAAAGILGDNLPREKAERLLLWSGSVILVLCIVLALAVPDVGTMAYGGDPVWRGLFTNKNEFGWFASLMLLMAVMLRRPSGNRLSTVLALLALVCLLGSDSKGGLAAALAALAYIFLLRWLIPKVTPGFGIALVLVVMVVGLVVFTLGYVPLVELLGRDATLTGRTTIWQTYFASMSAHPWLGSGPGAYTVQSPLTAMLASRLESFGVIYTPHSSYLGVFGDTGLFGLVIFIGMLIHLALVEPFYRTNRMYLLSGSLCFLIAASGVVETHNTYTPGPGWFLLILVRTLAIRERANAAGGERRETAVPSGRSTGTYRYAQPLPRP
ncbi:O-antigen ligase family protein [Duganella levis]|uniref:O-antigen ligase-related domain-containing protein n=1 Tax=Duganella levis TaxID=2692169 RepID=A0ABW9W696_9BURK|nr:O-antigen ligase family protein [Duganella levis]MYN29070.1 hypothetical protein [Duganella levis]